MSLGQGGCGWARLRSKIYSQGVDLAFLQDIGYDYTVRLRSPRFFCIDANLLCEFESDKTDKLASLNRIVADKSRRVIVALCIFVANSLSVRAATCNQRYLHWILYWSQDFLVNISEMLLDFGPEVQVILN